MILYNFGRTLLQFKGSIVQRCPDICYSRNFAFAFEKLSSQLVSGFQNKVQRPDFFAGTLQEAKRPGRGGSGSDEHHQALAQGEFDSSVKSDFTVARPSSLFWRGTVKMNHVARGRMKFVKQTQTKAD